MMGKDGSSKTAAYKFKIDGDKTHCAKWISDQNLLSFLGLFVAGVIGSVNVGVELIIGAFSEFFSRPTNF